VLRATRKPKVYVECKPDELLVKRLGVPRKIIHAGNKTEVCKHLKNIENSLGVVDEDPYSEQPEYLRDLIANGTTILDRNDIKVLDDKERNNRLIILCPRLEDWVIRTAKDAGIELEKFGLPDDPNRLHRIINSNLDKFEIFLEALLHSNSKRIDDLVFLFAHL